jgi:hypothetical protein
MKLLDIPESSLRTTLGFISNPTNLAEIVYVALVCKLFLKALQENIAEQLFLAVAKHGLIESMSPSIQSYHKLYYPKVFLIGGNLSERICTIFYPLKGTFQRMCSLGIKRSSEFIAVYHRGILFSLSGFDFPSVVEAYDQFNNEWQQVESLPAELISPAVISHQQDLYILGGVVRQSSQRSNCIYRLSIHNEELPVACLGDLQMSWKLIGNLQEGRSHCGIASYGGLIWLAGGIVNGQFTSTNTVELYDPIIGMTTPGPPMLRQRSTPKLLVIDDCLYAIGGDIDDIVFAVGSIEKFDLIKQDWVFVTFFLEPRRRVHCAIAAFQSKIFLFGGVYGNNIWTSWDYYDVRRHYWASQAQQNLSNDLSMPYRPSEEDLAYLQKVNLLSLGQRREGISYTVALTNELVHMA